MRHSEIIFGAGVHRIRSNRESLRAIGRPNGQVQGISAEGQIGLMIGPPGSGKTMLANGWPVFRR